MPTLSAKSERLLLQIMIAVCGFVPVGTGLVGGILGAAMIDGAEFNVSLDSHVRYLSGLLLAIGLAFWEAIPQIEKRTSRVRLLTAIVVLGGLMRLIGLLFVATPDAAMLFGLGMELIVTPIVCLWQTRIAHRVGSP